MLGKIRKTSGKFIGASVNSEIFRYISHIILSVLLGLLAGAGGILFHSLLEFMRSIFGASGEGVPGIWIIGVPAAGALVSSAMTWMAPAISRQRGVVSVIKSVILKNGFIPIKETVFHLFAPIVSIGTGIPLGPEGPSAKIGSGIGSFMSQLLKLGKNDMVMYTVAGAGAAISAVFNAPIAGVFFGIEVILMNDMRNRAMSALIISSVVADILSRFVLGSTRVITIPQYSIGDLSWYPFFVGLAVCCGLAAMLYFVLSDSIGTLLDDRLKIRNPFIKLLPASLLFGLVLVKFPQLFGIGYNTINNVLAQVTSFSDAAWLLGLKIFFIALLARCGAYGGTFAPSLGIGALAGFVFAESMNAVFNVSLDSSVFALVGMGGVLAAVNSIPMTSILLVIEMTNDYRFILPLMLVSVISYLVVLYCRKGTVYNIALLKDNIDVTRKGEMDILRKIHVRSILRTDMDAVDYRTPFRKLMSVIVNSKYGDIVVTDDAGRLAGFITLRDVRQALIDNDLVDLLIAQDLMSDVPAVGENDPLSVAIQKMDRDDIENIPVTDESGRFTGIITHNDIIHSYEKLIGNMDNTESLTGNFYYPKQK